MESSQKRTYRLLQYFAVFSANTKHIPTLPSVMIKTQADTAADRLERMIKTQADTAADRLERRISRESGPNGDDIDPLQSRFCSRVG